MSRESEIQLIAYRIWEEDGCCDGRDLEHWLRAEIVWEEQQKPANKPATKAKQAYPAKKQPPVKKAQPKPATRAAKNVKPANPEAEAKPGVEAPKTEEKKD